MLINNIQMELAAIWFIGNPIEIVRDGEIIKKANRVIVGDQIRVENGFVYPYGLVNYTVIACMGPMDCKKPYFKCKEITTGDIIDVQIM